MNEASTSEIVGQTDAETIAQLRAQLAGSLEREASQRKEFQQFVYACSHELNAPMRGIRQLSQWINEEETALSEETGRYLDLMTNRVNRLQLLLDSLLVYSRISRLELSPEPIDLEQEISTTLQLVLRARSLSPASLSLSVVGDLPELLIPRAIFAFSLKYLFENVLDHGYTGDTSNAAIEIAYAHVAHDGTQLEESSGSPQEPSFHRIYVRDGGKGVSASSASQIFEVFYPISNSDLDLAAGMGLAHVIKAIANVGGRALLLDDRAVKEVDGRFQLKGALFCLDFPVHP